MGIHVWIVYTHTYIYVYIFFLSLPPADGLELAKCLDAIERHIYTYTHMYKHICTHTHIYEFLIFIIPLCYIFTQIHFTIIMLDLAPPIWTGSIFKD